MVVLPHEQIPKMMKNRHGMSSEIIREITDMDKGCQRYPHFCALPARDITTKCCQAALLLGLKGVKRKV
jgi:hypothetical protein